MAILIMATVINFLLYPAGALAPLLVTKHFGPGAIELGWLNSIFGIGIIAGGLALSARGGFRRRIVTSLMGIISVATAMSPLS